MSNIRIQYKFIGDEKKGNKTPVILNNLKYIIYILI